MFNLFVHASSRVAPLLHAPRAAFPIKHLGQLPAASCSFGTRVQKQKDYKQKAQRPKGWKLKRLKTSVDGSINQTQKENVSKGDKRLLKRELAFDSELVSDVISATHLRTGLVLERLGDQLLVEVPAEEPLLAEVCRPPQLLKCFQKQHMVDVKVVPGDRVRVDVSSLATDAAGWGEVVDIEERTNLLQRPTAFSNGNKITMKAIASNIDQLVIVTATLPITPIVTIDRYIIAARHYGIKDIVLVVNKCDLPGSDALLSYMQYYATNEHLGYTLLQTSAETGEGVDDLKVLLEAKTSILVGQSGIGKSSLINLIIPDLNARVNELVRVANIGSHTTSNTRLYHLPPNNASADPNDEDSENNTDSGCILDSPGIRELGVWHLPDHAILSGFGEIEHHATGCKFRNCRHSYKEAKFCNVQHAVQQGFISPSRYTSFAEMTCINTEEEIIHIGAI